MNRPRRAAPLALAAAALVRADCALVTVSQRQEIQMGRGYSSQPNEELPPVRDAPIRGYVNEAGTGIASRTDRPDLPYEFQVVNTDVVNAFAVPGGAARAGIGIGANLYVARSGRAQESEADSLAVGYPVRSGWGPQALRTSAGEYRAVKEGEG